MSARWKFSNLMFISIAVALFFVVGMGSAWAVFAQIRPATLADLIEGAKKETVLKGQWSSSGFGGSLGLEKIAKGMNKQYGFKIKTQFTPGPNMQRMMGKIAREVAAGQPASSDVYLGNSQGLLHAQKNNVLKSYDWVSILERPLPSEPGFSSVAPGGIGVVFATTLVGLIYNSDLVKGGDIPKRLSDVLKPKWKGRIASTPYAAGMREFAMPDVLGREAVFDFMRKLSKQISGLMRCGAMDRITSGEFLMLVLACGESNVNMARRRGMPLGYALLQDAIVAHTRYAGVPKNSAAPNAAALLIAYLHTPEGQKLLWDLDGLDLHLISRIEPKEKSRQGTSQWSEGSRKLAAVAWFSQALQADAEGASKDPGKRRREGEEEKIGSVVGLISSAWKGPGTFHAALFHP